LRSKINRCKINVLRTLILQRLLTKPKFSAAAIGLAEGIADRLATWERPVVTAYELGVLLCATQPDADDVIEPALYKAIVDRLSSFHLISPAKDFKPGAVFQLFGRPKPSAMEVACAVDPFACVTHLSAMEFHGLTDRFSKILYLTTPPDKEWREQSEERMARDLGQHMAMHRAARLPMLRYLGFERVEGVRVELMRRSSRGAFKAIKSPAIRVAMVGRVFLDMVREPDNCGGMQHVVDAYREYGSQYLSLILDEIDRHGKPIEKVRAGYLLEAVCRIQHPRIDGWKDFAQRGGSRMLDPQGEYAPTFSETWKLSINVPSLLTDGRDGEGQAGEDLAGEGT
jgi:predicted transcriptional regulator of viral defense system